MLKVLSFISASLLFGASALWTYAKVSDKHDRRRRLKKICECSDDYSYFSKRDDDEGGKHLISGLRWQ